MTICTRTTFFAFLFASASFGQKDVELAAIISKEIEKCQIHVTADSTAFFASREPLLATLQKEYNTLEQEYFGICQTEKSTKEGLPEYCDDILKKYRTKKDECRELFAPLYGRICYKSQDLYIGARIMVRPDCGKVKSFLVGYEKNGIKYDSTYYSNDGDWNVEERSANAFISRHSSGERNEWFNDDQGRVTGHFWINRKNDTLVSERYFWENGKLVKTILGGVERIFTYGTPCDSVIVDPPDPPKRYFNLPNMFHKSFGLIPEENDPEYEKFKRNPYDYRPHNVSSDLPDLVKKQKRRCEEYKESQKKKEGGK